MALCEARGARATFLAGAAVFGTCFALFLGSLLCAAADDDDAADARAAPADEDEDENKERQLPIIAREATSATASADAVGDAARQRARPARALVPAAMPPTSKRERAAMRFAIELPASPPIATSQQSLRPPTGLSSSSSGVTTQVAAPPRAPTATAAAFAD